MACKRDKHKIRQIAKEYIREGFDLPKAIAKVEGNRPYSGNYLNVKACALRYSDEMQEALRKELATFDKTLANEQYVFKRLLELIDNNEGKDSVKVEAIKLLAECIGLRSDSKIQNVQVIGSDRLKNIIDTTKVEPATTIVNYQSKAS